MTDKNCANFSLATLSFKVSINKSCIHKLLDKVEGKLKFR